MALLSERPRSATAKAIGFCDIYLLHKSSFQRVIEAYPEFRHHIEEVMHKRKAA
jgi:CRP-like cAMP-binding protein